MVPLTAPASGYDPLSPPPPPRPSGPATMWRFLVWMVRTDPARAAAVLGLFLVTGLVPAGVVWVLSHTFDAAVAAARGAAPFSALLTWMAVWAALALLQTAGWPLSDVVLERLRQEMEDALQLRLQRKAAALRLEVFERADFTDILRRAREATAPGFFLTLLRPLFDMPRAAATLIALAAVVGAWSPWLWSRLRRPTCEIVTDGLALQVFEK